MAFVIFEAAQLSEKKLATSLFDFFILLFRIHFKMVSK